ncbi:uncharacterized [Tachysurus ichikawai]
MLKNVPFANISTSHIIRTDRLDAKTPNTLPSQAQARFFRLNCKGKKSTLKLREKENKAEQEQGHERVFLTKRPRYKSAQRLCGKGAALLMLRSLRHDTPSS